MVINSYQMKLPALMAESPGVLLGIVCVRGIYMASIAFGLICLACLLLSLSLRRHYRQAFAGESAYEKRKWPLRVSGYGCTLLALWPCVREFGWAIGPCLWLSVLALAAFLQIMLLTYRPRATAVFGCLGVALIALGLLM